MALVERLAVARSQYILDGGLGLLHDFFGDVLGDVVNRAGLCVGRLRHVAGKAPGKGLFGLLAAAAEVVGAATEPDAHGMRHVGGIGLGQGFEGGEAEDDDLDGAEEFGAGAGAVGGEGFQGIRPCGGEVCAEA